MAIHLACIIFVVMLEISDVSSVTIPAVQGSTITLTCNKIPSSNLVWEHRAVGGIIIQGGVLLPSVTSSKYEVTQSVSSESLVVNSVTLADDGEYRCYYISRMNYAEIHTINILVEPRLVNATGPMRPVSQGTNQTLSCRVYGAKPLPEMKWIRIDSLGRRTELPCTYEDDILSDKTGNRQCNLLIPITREMYRATFLCSASISYFYTVHSSVVLDVYLLPLQPVISGVGSSYDPGRISSVRCEVNGARPPAVISWTMDGSRMQNLVSPPQQLPDGTFVTVSTLLISMPSNEDEVQVTCSASNEAVIESGSNPPTSNESIKVNYAPRVKKVNHTTIFVKEGEDGTIECIVLSRPLPSQGEVTWWKNSVRIQGSRYIVGQGSNLSLTIRDVTRNDTGQYRCEVYNHLGYANGEPIMLNVLHKPYCSEEQKRKYAVPLGSSAKVKCVVEAFPNNVSFFWSYDGISQIAMSKAGETDPGDSEHAYSYISVNVRRVEDYKSVVCNASSSLGAMMEDCFIQLVKPGPTEAPVNCVVTKVTNTSLSVICQPGFDGGYRQTFTLMQSGNGGQYTSGETWDNPEFYVSGLFSDTSYSFLVCSSNNRFQDFKNCSLAVTTRTLTGVNDRPDSVQPTIEAAAIGAYIAVAVCCVMLLAFAIVGLTYWFVHRRSTDTKSSPGRVVVSRSTGSLVFDVPTKRWQKPAVDVYEGEEYGRDNSVCNSTKERQLQAIVERIDWQEGVTSLHVVASTENIQSVDKHSVEVSQEQTSQSAHLATKSPDDIPQPNGGIPLNIGHSNPAFNDDNVAENVIKKPEPRKHLDYSLEDFTIIADTDYDGNSETTIDITDEESVTQSPSKCRLDVNVKEQHSAMDRGLEHQCELLIRRGSYNLAMVHDDDSMRSSSSEERDNVSNMNDSRYAGIQPAYF